MPLLYLYPECAFQGETGDYRYYEKRDYPMDWYTEQPHLGGGVVDDNLIYLRR
jgi:hypothetical protein